LKGMIIDHVADFAQPQGQGSPQDTFVKEYYGWLLKQWADEKLDRQYPLTGENFPEPMWRTMCANFDGDKPADRELSQGFRIWARQFGVDWCDCSGEAPELHQSHKFDEALAYTGCGSKRVPFRTRKGYIGLSDPGIEQGDCVCLMQGASVPYLTRKGRLVVGQGPQRCPQLLCECYVHGLMHGEGLTDGRWEDLYLR
jgi:hypothetical protein